MLYESATYYTFNAILLSSRYEHG